MRADSATADTLTLERSASFEEIISSFAERVQPRWRRALPLTVLLVIQALVSLRLHSAVSMDESLYINDGRLLLDHWLHGSIMPDDPSSYFSGAPALYPVFAGAIFDAFGVTAVRLVALLFMLGATVGVYTLASQLFDGTLAFLASVLFIFAGPISFLGLYATYDAPTVFFVSITASLAVRQARLNQVWQSALLGPLLVLICTIKYAGAAYVPFILLLAVVVGWRQSRSQSLLRALLSLGSTAVILAPLILKFGHLVKNAVLNTTVSRTPVVHLTTVGAIRDVLFYVAPLILLSAVGAVLLARTRWILALTLLGASLIVDVYQIHLQEDVSLSKHTGFGLVFACPLAAYGVVEGFKMLRRLRVAGVIATAAMACSVLFSLIFGLSRSAEMYHFPNVPGLVAPVVSSDLKRIDAPNGRIFTDDSNTLRLADVNTLSFDQVSYILYFPYKGYPTGLPAFRAAAKDHYFQLIEFNTERTADCAAYERTLRQDGYYLSYNVRIWHFERGYFHIWLLSRPRS